MEAHFLGEYTESYMPAGNLLLRFPEGVVTDYCRELSLDQAEAEVSFQLNGKKISRKAFVSFPQKAMILRWESEAALDCVEIQYESRMMQRGMTKQQWGLQFDMQCPEHADPHYLAKAESGIIWGDQGMRFPLSLRVLETDGEWTAEQDRLLINGARTAVLAVSVLDEWPGNLDGFEAYEQEHRKDYQALYSRVELEMPGRSDLPTDEWLHKPDPGLYALYYQYGRYLLISSAREGSLPPNLQGIWCWQLLAPWSSNWTTNINAEMNYWPALTGNLQECVQPYIAMVKRLCEEGKKTAACFGCSGSCTGHNTDGWGQTNPVGVARGDEKGQENLLPISKTLHQSAVLERIF